MYAAYEGLPEHLRERVAGLQIKHDSTHNSAGHLRFGMEKPVDLSVSPGAVHPAVCTHPQSKRKALFLGRRPNAYIMGLPLEESEALLDELWTHCQQEKYYWHHQWQVDDLVLWDNRCAMHRRDAFDNSERRVMYRTQIVGHKPYLAA
jgi:taurine dioxygenase